jgi:hypothetical protein
MTKIDDKKRTYSQIPHKVKNIIMKIRLELIELV